MSFWLEPLFYYKGKSYLFFSMCQYLGEDGKKDIVKWH